MKLKKNSRRLIQQAKEHLAKGERRQAVETAWCAVDHWVREIARKNGWQYETCVDFHLLTPLIAQLMPDPRLTRLLLTLAVYLITDYHPKARTLEGLRHSLDDVKILLDILDGPQFRELA